MSETKITIDFRFNKKTGRHVLTVKYRSLPGTPMYMHNRAHDEILGQVADALKKQGLDIGDFEVQFDPLEDEPVRDRQPQSPPPAAAPRRKIPG